MTFYSEMRGTALELLTEFGQPITLRRTVAGDYDPATGTASTTIIDEPRFGALFDYNDYLHGIQSAPRQAIEIGDRRCYLDGNGSEPTMNDKLIIGGVEWSLKNIKAVNPGGVAVLYDIQVSR